MKQEQHTMNFDEYMSFIKKQKKQELIHQCELLTIELNKKHSALRMRDKEILFLRERLCSNDFYHIEFEIYDYDIVKDHNNQIKRKHTSKKTIKLFFNKQNKETILNAIIRELYFCKDFNFKTKILATNIPLFKIIKLKLNCLLRNLFKK